jgi:hypothetical protein
MQGNLIDSPSSCLVMQGSEFLLLTAATTFVITGGKIPVTFYLAAETIDCVLEVGDQDRLKAVSWR